MQAITIQEAINKLHALIEADNFFDAYDTAFGGWKDVYVLTNDENSQDLDFDCMKETLDALLYNICEMKIEYNRLRDASKDLERQLQGDQALPAYVPQPDAGNVGN